MSDGRDAGGEPDAEEGGRWDVRSVVSRHLPHLVTATIAVTVLLLIRRSIIGEAERIFFQFDVPATEIKVYGATRLRQLTGAFSTFGFQHPGPWYFYWMAPFYVLSGHRVGGLQIGTAVLHVLALGVTVAIVQRYGGRAIALVLGVVVAVWTQRYGLDQFFAVWNPMVTSTLSILLIAAIGAMVARREEEPRWLLALVIGVGSLLVQAHVGAAPIVASAGLVALVTTIGRVRGRALVRLLVPALVVGFTLWSPVLVDQVADTGNLGDLNRHFVLGQDVDEGEIRTNPFARERERMNPRDVLPPVTAALTLRLDDLGRNAGITVAMTDRVRTGGLDGLLLGSLISATAFAGWGARRRHPFVAATAGVTLASVAGVLLAAVMARGSTFHLYQMHFVTGIGFWLWAVPVIAVAAEARRRMIGIAAPRVRTIVAWTLAVAAAGTVLITSPDSLRMHRYRRASAADALVEMRPDLRAINIDAEPTWLKYQLINTVDGLLHAGVEVHAPSRWSTVLASDQSPTRSDLPTVVLSSGRVEVPDSELIGSWESGGGKLTVHLNLVPAEDG